VFPVRSEKIRRQDGPDRLIEGLARPGGARLPSQGVVVQVCLWGLATARSDPSAQPCGICVLARAPCSWPGAISA